MPEKIAVLDTGYESFQYEQELFTSNGFNFEIFDGEKGDVEGKMRFASDAVGLMIRWTEVNEKFLGRMSNLKAIVRYGVGYENVDLKACTNANVHVSNVQGYCNHAVSDHALALMLALHRMLSTGKRIIIDQFGAPPSGNIKELHEMILGIVGLGRIGSTMSKKVKNLFKSVVAYDPYIADEQFEKAEAEKVEFNTLLSSSDIISLHCNLTETSERLIDRNAFIQMAKHPILINTARGPVVDQHAMIDALDEGWIRAAGIDVFNTELAAQLPLDIINHPKVMATGHYAWYSERSQRELQRRAADNLLSMLNGNQPDDCLNP